MRNHRSKEAWRCSEAPRPIPRLASRILTAPGIRRYAVWVFCRGDGAVTWQGGGEEGGKPPAKTPAPRIRPSHQEGVQTAWNQPERLLSVAGGLLLHRSASQPMVRTPRRSLGAGNSASATHAAIILPAVEIASRGAQRGRVGGVACNLTTALGSFVIVRTRKKIPGG